MRTTLRMWLRVLAISFLWAVASPPAAATGPFDREENPPPAARRETLWGLPRDDPAIAVGAIVGGIALLVFFAWIAARIGDKN
jgi:hypothetical protein